MAPFGASGIWDLADGSEIDEQRLPKPALNCLYIDDERAYVIGLLDGQMRVHRSSDHTLVRQLEAHHNGVRGLALAPGGRELVSASFDGRLIVWRTAALVEPGAAARGSKLGLFCAVAADGSAGWAVTATVDTYHASFAVKPLGAAEAGPQPERSRPLWELPIKRNDPLMPMQVFETTLTGIGPRAAHRSSPLAGDGACWLVHAGARMSPSSFHLLPPLPKARWASENVTWSRAADGRQTGVVREALHHDGNEMRRRVSALWFADDGARKPVTTVEFDLPLAERVGACHFSADGRRLRLAAGAALLEVDRDGRQRRFADGDSPVSAFCESHNAGLLVVAHADGHLQLWDAERAAPLRRYDAHRGDVVDAVFVDSRRFVSVGRDGTLRLWRSTSARCEAVFVAGAALVAVDAGQRGHRLLALDVHGTAYWLSVERGARANRRSKAP